MANNDFSWSAVVGKVVINTVSHPLEYAKVLIQLGHEPIPPYPTRTLFGRPALALPSIFQYVAHIKRVDGLAGCYRGLGAKLCSVVVSGYVYHCTLDSVRDASDTDVDAETEDLSPQLRGEKFAREVRQMALARAAAVVASQPFTVVAVRTMAQFVGGEKIYVGIFASIGEIYREEGIMGFFKGLVPRLLGELIALIISSTFTHFVNNLLVKDREFQSYVSITSSYLATSLTYPFQVVSNCMAVANTRLAAGNPPYMPGYTTWGQCWRHLGATGQLKRGSSLLWRYYTVLPAA
ncbi:mitochondrial carrier homolog 2-like [Bacillus rossius redtenbacheri]|uniref:mitochondrial carrier homolog 2-like n=1 Tax=Bacillus rossius redtenbacheri TaxID=93214 RepID=UPI002FDE9850